MSKDQVAVITKHHNEIYSLVVCTDLKDCSLDFMKQPVSIITNQNKTIIPEEIRFGSYGNIHADTYRDCYQMSKFDNGFTYSNKTKQCERYFQEYDFPYNIDAILE